MRRPLSRSRFSPSTRTSSVHPANIQRLSKPSDTFDGFLLRNRPFFARPFITRDETINSNSHPRFGGRDDKVNCTSSAGWISNHKKDSKFFGMVTRREQLRSFSSETPTSKFSRANEATIKKRYNEYVIPIRSMKSWRSSPSCTKAMSVIHESVVLTTTNCNTLRITVTKSTSKGEIVQKTE